MHHNLRMLPHQQYILCIFEAQRSQQQPFGPRKQIRVNHHHRLQRAECELKFEPLLVVCCALIKTHIVSCRVSSSWSKA